VGDRFVVMHYDRRNEQPVAVCVYDDLRTAMREARGMVEELAETYHRPPIFESDDSGRELRALVGRWAVFVEPVATKEA
jgi:hypothetical protein